MTAPERTAEQSPNAPYDHYWRTFVATRDTQAREALFQLYMPYARTLAAQLYAGRHRNDVDFNDFRQLALVGLLEAIDRFDPQRSVSFETFCTRRIRGAVLDGVQKLTDAQEQISFMQRAQRERLASLEAAGAANRAAPHDTFERLAQLTAGLAIGYMLDDTGLLAHADNTPSPIPAPWQSVAWRQTRQRLLLAVSGLPERDHKIIHYHYFNGLRFDQIADILGVSKARVSQLHHAALARLRDHLGGSRQLYTIG
ncbi:sigma-70 family RNA polymerase sigma factor [Caballeronia telluris]|uniref:RNA polymerase sigma70 n=1 Tax=Caballeronia telluris TaxID=326475 RepID=A0A158EST5_9BURK|nr:sigma-70 family RNA polymerase sigma factor [Caballeronia telluris]SAL10576.1 RNA polymerase sigma70 [Caballeronia telluris]